jgi:hypothetical protein
MAGEAVMGGEAVASPARGLSRPPGTEPVAAEAACALEAVAAVLSRLLRRAVSAEEVGERAVGLGLMRLPEPGAAPLLTAEAASRLLLAGYRLPAQAGPGTLPELREHLAAGRHAFVLLGMAGAWQVHALVTDLDGSTRLLASRAAAPDTPLEEMPPGSVADLRIVAARQWADLPASGSAFFGGGRDRDGSFHWDAAEYDTDGAGRILRC